MGAHITLRRVCVAHAGTEALFTTDDLTFVPGWTGVVGANGAGKSTLLRVLHGDVVPAEGRVQFDPRDAIVHLCAQSVDALDDAVRRFAEDDHTRRWRAELGLDPRELDRWTTLSPGERRRWQVGAALALEPDVLLLDEPANHLDADARRWFTRALTRFRGTGLLVSHDRALLDAVTEHTARIHQGAITLWPGAFTDARAQWERERNASLQAHADAANERKRLTRSLADTRRELDAAERQRSASARMKSKLDHDARGALAKGKAALGEAAWSRRAGVLRRDVERATHALDTHTVTRSREDGAAITFPYAPCPRATVLSHDHDVLRTDDVTLAQGARVALARGEHVWLRGRNGAGKSTLLRAMVAESSLPPERMLYLPQELAPEAIPSALDALRTLDRETRGRLLAIVDALGSDPSRLLATPAPSPGEARKLTLALAMARGAWALALDEPTNHMDLPSIERLQDALARFPGALVVVTHDDALGRACCRTAWTIADGALRVESLAS